MWRAGTQKAPPRQRPQRWGEPISISAKDRHCLRGLPWHVTASSQCWSRSSHISADHVEPNGAHWEGQEWPREADPGSQWQKPEQLCDMVCDMLRNDPIGWIPDSPVWQAGNCRFPPFYRQGNSRLRIQACLTPEPERHNRPGCPSSGWTLSTLHMRLRGTVYPQALSTSTLIVPTPQLTGDLTLPQVLCLLLGYGHQLFHSYSRKTKKKKRQNQNPSIHSN